MIYVPADCPLQAECTAKGADWFRSMLGRVIETPQHGPAVVLHVDHYIDQARQEARYFVTVKPIKTVSNVFVETPAQGCY